MPANLENSAVATGLEKVSFHSNPKERQCQRMLKLSHNCKWQPTPVPLPGKYHGWRSVVDYSPWGHKESDMTERLHFTSHTSIVILKILQARLQEYINQELPDVQAGFRKGNQKHGRDVLFSLVYTTRPSQHNNAKKGNKRHVKETEELT